MDADVLLFFDGRPASLALYEAFARRVTAAVPGVQIKAQKTQISFYNRHLFACVSFLPVRRAGERPRDYITVTVGLDYPLDSPRVDVKTEARPNRWTHHFLIASESEIDGELMGWVRQAAVFAAGKR